MTTLVIVAHPNIEASRGNKALRDAIANEPNIVIHDLYKLYPDFQIDVAAEQQLLRVHGNIVLQFPMYWYSSPPLLKKWFDDVINDTLFGGAPETSTIFAGRTLQLVVTIGRVRERYFPVSPDYVWDEAVLRPYIKPNLIEAHGDGIVDMLLLPFEQSAHLAGLTYAEPFITYSVGSLARVGSIDETELETRGERYRELVRSLSVPATADA
jgi:putative NADPH-quinone reductase